MSRRSLGGLARDRRAVTAVEFAVVGVGLLTLIFGSIEFGRLLWVRQALQATAIQAARCIGVLATSCAAGGAYSEGKSQTYIIGLAGGWGVAVTAANLVLNPDASTGACSGKMSDVAEVTISYTFQSAVPALLPMLSSKALTGRACFPRQAS
jgi:Flp pilus assembly protein TadG